MIMRLVSFFILSVALHAAALAYPVSFGARSQGELIEVTILLIEQETIGGKSNRGSENPAPPASSKPAMRVSPTVRPSGQSNPAATAPAPTAINRSSAPEPKTLPVEASDGLSDGRIALASPVANSASIQSSALMDSLGNAVNGRGTNGNGSGGSGLGSGGTASVNASGQGRAENGIVMTQARYRDTPRPSYPESARREGHEGRVLLRVLVDDQGRTETVEINDSSGSAALDRAAAEAIQRWLFHPARYDDRPIASWLRIPIEFRLADAKSW